MDLPTPQLAKFSNVTNTDYCESKRSCGNPIWSVFLTNYNTIIQHFFLNIACTFASTAPLCRLAVNIMHEIYLLGLVKIISTV